MQSKKSPTRIERDALGTVKVPKDAYYGAFTARALQNFQISGIPAHPAFRTALAYIKKAAAQTNAEIGEIEKKHAQAIIKAADEFLSGKFNDQFLLDVFQAGAGTPFNMNLNEILANRANELLGSKKGTYKPVTPNNHINWGQSSNDAIPTALRIAALMQSQKLLPEVKKLSQSFFKKGRQFKNIVKVGRTHLQDAVPITMGQEFEAWGAAIQRSHDTIKRSFEELKEVAIGGTALGTGITAHPKYRALMVKNLRSISGFKLRSTKYPMELSANMNSFSRASSALRCLANDLIRISRDLRILASGPAGGIHEIHLPEVEPGSSIMPGKVNPSIPECVSMIGFQVIGNDQTINAAVQSSELELNVMTPIIMMNLLWSAGILRAGSETFRTMCVDGIKANKERCQEVLAQSLCLATGLSPYLGYKVTAELVKESLKKKQTLIETVKLKKFMPDKELGKILSAKRLTSPQTTDKTLKQKIEQNRNYQNYLKKLGQL